MRQLVTLTQVKRDLKITHDLDDDNLSLKIDHASAFVMDYMKVPDDTYDEPAAIPLIVQAAAMEVVRNLYEQTGEDPVTPTVKSLLMRMRDPALA